jgi:hypothetical protein
MWNRFPKNLGVTEFMTDESELGDFDPQNDNGTEEQTEPDADSLPHPPQPGEERELVGSRTPGRGVPELRDTRSAHDRQIRAGDPVRDLWGGAWLIAVKKKADTVTEYDQQQPETKQSLLSYEGSIGVGATEDDAVWACFYLNQNNTLAGGRSGPYDFPESRICRYAYEDTDGYQNGRFQDHIQMQVLEQVADAVLRSGNEQIRGNIVDLMADAFGLKTAQKAFELAEASRGDQL